MTKKQSQLKIAEILFDLGIDESLVEIMTSLSQEDLKEIKQ